MSARAQTVRLTPAQHRTLVGFAKSLGLSEYAMLARVVDAGLAALVHGAGNEVDTREIIAELASVSVVAARPPDSSGNGHIPVG